MKSLNEYLARKANAEDNCKGRFWESRFKSQALLDEAAVLMCMSYVDLNPIRAGIAELPESSDFTSVQQRIQEWRQFNISNTTSTLNENSSKNFMPLLAFSKNLSNHIHSFSYSTIDYIELVDWAGRIIRENKRGAISANAPLILDRLNIDPQRFMEAMQQKRKRLSLPIAIGCRNAIKQFAINTQRKFIRHFNMVKPIIG